MKAFGAILLSLLAAAPAAAQQPAGAPAPAEAHGVSVVKASWRRQFYNPALEDDPLRATDDTAQLQRERRDTMRDNNERSKTGRERLPMPTRPSDGTVGIVESDPRVSYLYQIKVVNRGAKKIRSVVWEYVLFDPATGREVGRHSFETKAGIGVGKDQTLSARSELPPASVVDVKKTDKEARGQYSERVEIRRVLYEDGTVWERERE
ncbi:MAG TPA: hypothetical protein VF736_07300 [Pyrinomonadaceae bacterium]|jgi:hypothetical protein